MLTTRFPLALKVRELETSYKVREELHRDLSFMTSLGLIYCSDFKSRQWSGFYVPTLGRQDHLSICLYACLSHASSSEIIATEH